MVVCQFFFQIIIHYFIVLNVKKQSALPFVFCVFCTISQSLLCLQERLLLSLLPAHIARVMKAEIIQRLQGPNFGRTESTNNFHNLYVQRHTNVR